MSAPLTALLLQIQIILFTGSGLLLAGSLIGLYAKNRALSEPSKLFFSGNDAKPDSRKTACHEQRRARRITSDRSFELKNSAGLFVGNSGRIRDISVRGARFDSPVLLKRGERIEARLHSSKEGLLQIDARIVWLQPKSDRVAYGVEFDAIRPDLS
jgi:hypothetical protein